MISYELSQTAVDNKIMQSVDLEKFNNKTVFVLDHTQYFGISAENSFELESVNNKPLDPPLKIPKSLWTTSVETTVEYCRIVWDLFPIGKLIRFIVSDTNAHIVNTWLQSTQNLSHIMNAMAMVSVPPNTPQSTDFSVIHGLRAAIEALIEPTEKQLDDLVKGEKNVNNGRVVCITSARDDSSMKSLEDIFTSVLQAENSKALTAPNVIPIDQCHLVIINLYPSNIESMVSNRPLHEVGANFFLEIHSVKARDFSNKMTHLILPHYDLASTTVTGIPMKEEQNASSSANYDVEIFHARNSHSVILSAELLLPTSIKDGVNYETVTLKWCTPRGIGASDMQPCLAQHRVTPVDVTSRPSSCLINFLLNGRSVLLEMPRKTGGKLTSHLLSAHGGEIFIHTLQVSRSCLDDLPSILEGAGGKVTDYRISDFAAHIQRHKLLPLISNIERGPDVNLQKARGILCKNSKYWPLTSTNTIIYNVRQFLDPILGLPYKEELTEEEVLKCQQIIYNLVSFEARHEPLTLPISGNRLKGNKKDEQYRLLWAELELLLEGGPKTPGHNVILQCVRDCRSEDRLRLADKNETDAAVRGIGGSAGDSSKRALIIKATTDSPMSPPGSNAELMNLTKAKTQFFPTTGNRSLFDLKVLADQVQSQKRVDLSGRLCSNGDVAQLYSNLKLLEADIEMKQ